MTHPSASYIKCFIKLGDVALVGEKGYKFNALLKSDAEHIVEVNLSTTAHKIKWISRYSNHPFHFEVIVRNFESVNED